MDYVTLLQKHAIEKENRPYLKREQALPHTAGQEDYLWPGV